MLAVNSSAVQLRDELRSHGQANNGRFYPAVGGLIEFAGWLIGAAVMHRANYARRVLNANCLGDLDRDPANVPAKMDSTVSWTACIFRVCRM